MSTNNKEFCIQFINVPESKETPDGIGACKICKMANLTPFKVTTCEDVLCGACWQASAFNLGDSLNKCLACEKPTELLCFKDYSTFITFNATNGELIPATVAVLDQINAAPSTDDAIKAMFLKALTVHDLNILDILLKYVRRKREDYNEYIAKRKENTFNPNDGQASKRMGGKNRIFPRF